MKYIRYSREYKDSYNIGDLQNFLKSNETNDRKKLYSPTNFLDTHIPISKCKFTLLELTFLHQND